MIKTDQTFHLRLIVLCLALVPETFEHRIRTNGQFLVCSNSLTTFCTYVDSQASTLTALHKTIVSV